MSTLRSQSLARLAGSGWAPRVSDSHPPGGSTLRQRLGPTTSPLRDCHTLLPTQAGATEALQYFTLALHPNKELPPRAPWWLRAERTILPLPESTRECPGQHPDLLVDLSFRWALLSTIIAVAGAQRGMATRCNQEADAATAGGDGGENSYDAVAAIRGTAGLPRRIHRTCSGPQSRCVASCGPAVRPHDWARYLRPGDEPGRRDHCFR